MDAIPPERIRRFRHYDRIYKEFVRPVLPTSKVF